MNIDRVSWADCSVTVSRKGRGNRTLLHPPESLSLLMACGLTSTLPGLENKPRGRCSEQNIPTQVAEVPLALPGRGAGGVGREGERKQSGRLIFFPSDDANAQM